MKIRRANSPAFVLVIATFIAGCAATLPAVIESLDEKTAVTVTRPQTPLILSPNQSYAQASSRDYVQVAPIEVNRMGSLNYYLWLGIWDLDHLSSDRETPEGFDTISIIADGDTIELARLSWSHEDIGTSERFYKKIFGEDIDAYYIVSLDQVRQLSRANTIRLRSSGQRAKEYVPWYNQEKADRELEEFVRAVAL